MKRFLLKLFILFVLFNLFVFTIFMIVSPQYTNSYTGAFIDKMKILDSIQEPKIILVGNSNVAFGFKSEMIEKEFNMPVVNLGLHGGLGNSFHQRMALYNLHEGDIIIINHLTYDDYNEDILQPDLALITIENHLKYWKVLRFKDYPAILKNLQNYIFKCIDKKVNSSDIEDPEPSAYKRSSFNKYGDNCFFGEEYSENSEIYSLPVIGDKNINDLNKYIKYCEKHGVTVLIAGYPIIDDGDKFDFTPYISFQEELKRKVKCPVISDFKDYVFYKDLFADCNMHLNSKGATKRTEQLIKDLKKYLKK